MSNNELRKDYLLNRWVVIATERRRRPTDFVRPVAETSTRVCPFCPGNEYMTPPAVLLYRSSNGEIKKEKDLDGFRQKDWVIRCVPNLYPAFIVPRNEGEARAKQRSNRMKAIGHHEVLVESPHHNEHPGVARLSQLINVVNAYVDRLKELSSKNYVRYVSIFRNHGKEAGASLSHAHSQLIATPIVPSTVDEESFSSRKAWQKNNTCIFCEILKKEKAGPRLIWENDYFFAFTPWASIHPFEFWIFPKRHQSTLSSISQKETESFVKALRACFGGLNKLLNDPPYNFGFHLAPSVDDRDSYHWHLEVYPKLTLWGGFEKSTQVFINLMPPEYAASDLRNAILEEEQTL